MKIGVQRNVGTRINFTEEYLEKIILFVVEWMCLLDRAWKDVSISPSFIEIGSKLIKLCPK